MAERRRRRKLANNIDSEEGSDESEDEKKLTKSGSDVGDSEYESADEEELGEEEEELILVQDADGLGEDNKQLDDDEDRKNPQYIPKKGTFYEHDDRTAADLESSIDNEEIRTEAEITAKKNDLTSGKKKVWKEDDKWSHDKFVDYEQSPKTREELITIYGYDIRNEEGPPRARRRRRYGRGPNKYTRNWEDLDAYSKPSRGSPTLRGGGRGVPKGNRRVPENTEEEFPTLGSHHQHISDGDNERIQNEKYIHKPERYPSHQYDQHSSADPLEPQLHKDHPKSYTGEGRGRGRARGRGGPGGPGGRGQYKDSNRVNDGIGIGRGGGGSGQQYRPHNVSNRDQLNEISAELKNITISTGNIQQQQQQQQARDEQQHHHHHQHQQQQHHRGRGRGGGGRGSIPPRMQDASSANAGSNRGMPNNSGDGNSGEGNGGSSRPKRYSSQRQRSIPDQPGSPYQGQHQPYIEQGLDQGYGGFEGGSSNKGSNSSLGGQQQHLGSGSGGSFVPPAFTSGNNFPAEPFLGRPPAPRMFTPPSGPAPHMMPPGVAGSPVGVGGAPRVVGPPPVVGGVGGPPGVAGPPVGVPTVGGPPVTGPPFIPAENMISYVGPPPPHPGPPHLGPHPATAQFAGPPPPQFPPFQGYPPGPTSQPQEIYSNGVTYYNTQNQHIVPRVNPPLQKRPKAAIPIVPPPDSSSSNSSSNNQETLETNDVQDGSNPLESQEYSTGEQIQEMSKEDDSSPVNQIKEEVNGVEHHTTEISSPSAEIIKIEIQESSNEKKEGKENILYNEKTSLEEKIIDNTEVKKSETKEKVIEEKDVKKAVELSEEKVNDDKKCAGESGEAAVLVDTPIAAS